MRFSNHALFLLGICCLSFVHIAFPMHCIAQRIDSTGIHVNSNGQRVLSISEFKEPVAVGLFRPKSNEQIRIEIRNPLDVPVRILMGKASCACTSIKGQKELIASGKSGIVTMYIEPGDKEVNRAVSGTIVLTTRMDEQVELTEDDIIYVPFQLQFKVRNECSFSCQDRIVELGSGSNDEVTVVIENFSESEWFEPIILIDSPHLELVGQLVNESSNDEKFGPRQAFRMRLRNSPTNPLPKKDGGAPTEVNLILMGKANQESIVSRQIGETMVRFVPRQELEIAPKQLDIDAITSKSVGFHLISRDSNFKLDSSLLDITCIESELALTPLETNAVSDRWLQIELSREALRELDKQFTIRFRCYADSSKTVWRDVVSICWQNDKAGSK